LSRNLGTLTSWNPLGRFGPVTGLIYLPTLAKYLNISYIADMTSPYTNAIGRDRDVV